MTDDQLISIHKTLLDVNEVAALRAIYNAGYAAGSGVTVTAQTQDFSVAAAAPAEDVVKTLKVKSSQKK